jgi:hypothetical protein
VRVACVIPWRGGDPHREHHHQAVRERLKRILPDAVHIDADNNADPFSRAGSRNAGVRSAEQHAADVVVLCDADTIPQPGPLHGAIQGAHTDGRLHLPYTWYRGLTEQGSRDYLAGAVPEECEVDLAHEWATGGVLTIRPDAWWRAGGMDERFVAYGFEDTAFRVCADAILGPTIKHPGEIVHLWHPSAVGHGTDNHRRNAERHRLYEAAEGNPDAVRALLAERQAQARQAQEEDACR